MPDLSTHCDTGQRRRLGSIVAGFTGSLGGPWAVAGLVGTHLGRSWVQLQGCPASFRSEPE